MNEDIDQLQTLRRIRSNERERCERSVKAAAERRKLAVELLEQLDRVLAACIGRRDEAMQARVRRPADPIVADFCLGAEAALAEVRRELSQARTRVEEAVAALSLAHRQLMRAELWIETIEKRLRAARVRERKRQERRRDADTFASQPAGLVRISL